MATRTPENFAIETQLSTGASPVVPVVPASTSSIVRKLSFFNSSTTTSRTVTVYAVPSAGTAGTANTMAIRAIAPQKTWNCLEAQGEVLETGQSLQADQDAGTDVNANCSGSNIT